MTKNSLHNHFSWVKNIRTVLNVFHLTEQEVNKIKNPTKGHSHILWLRTILGVCILAAIVAWVINKGELFNRLNPQVLLWSTLISLLTSILQASTLTSIARSYHRRLDLRYALYISALGSLGNAAGGLPLGTTLKYTILYKRVGLNISQITFGLTAYIAGISLMLLGYAALSIHALDFQPVIKAIPTALFIVSIVALFPLGRWAQRNKVFSNLITPFLKKPDAITVAVLSFTIASLFILNSTVVGLFLFPEYSFFHVLFVSASGILLGLASLLQSVAGIQEITMGLTALASGINPLDGVQIALVMRFTSIISSGVIVSLLHLLGRHIRYT